MCYNVDKWISISVSFLSWGLVVGRCESPLMGYRLKVGQWILIPPVQVRILMPQPYK